MVSSGWKLEQIETWALAEVWTEFEIVSIREGSRMATESTLMHSALTAWFSGKPDTYNKLLEQVRHGR